MTDVPTAEDAPALDGAAATTPFPADRDLYLANLVSWANAGYSLSIILSVGGQTISGKTISGKAYFEAEKANLRLEDSEEDVGAWHEVLDLTFAPFIDAYDPLPKLDTIGYIHLKDAVIHQGDAKMTLGNGVHWRCKLERVDGFSLGKLG